MEWIDYVLTAAIGALVGTSELVARYRDNPTRALATLPAFVYIGLNAVASLAALAITRVFGWSFGFSGSSEGLRWIQVLTTGFGAMALFRTSLFTVRVGNQDIGIGPISLLQIALGAADRAVDRVRASSRSDTVVKIMKGVSFTKAKGILPPYCIALLQGASAEDQNALADNVRKLGTTATDDSTNALILGLLLMNLAGEKVLDSSVKALRQQIAQTQGGVVTATPSGTPVPPVQPPRPPAAPGPAPTPAPAEVPAGAGRSDDIPPAAAGVARPNGKKADESGPHTDHIE